MALPMICSLRWSRPTSKMRFFVLNLYREETYLVARGGKTPPWNFERGVLDMGFGGPPGKPQNGVGVAAPTARGKEKVRRLGRFERLGAQRTTMRQRILFAAMYLTLIATAPLASKVSLESRTYGLPGGGAVVLEVPVSWKEEVRQKNGDFPPTIIFREKKAELFEILVTLISSKSGQPPSIADLEASLLQSSRQHLANAVQESILLETLEGSQARGRYYLLTEEHPRANEYPSVIAGGLIVGPIVASFTVLLRDPTGSEAREALRVLRSATFESGFFGAYRATLRDLRFNVLLASAAGLTVETLVDDKRSYSVKLNDFLMEAQALDRGTIRIRIDGEELDKTGKLLEALTIGFRRIR